MEVQKINDFSWKLPRQGAMRVPGVVFASEKLLEKIQQDKTLHQLSNVATLKGILKNALAMPDCHEGYGFPIGGVAAFDMDEGIISPGGVGYDISCSVRILRTGFDLSEIMKKRQELIDGMFRDVPAGVGEEGKIRVTRDVLAEAVTRGTGWAVSQGYGRPEDSAFTEDNGCLKDADFSAISDKAMKRGMPQLGSLGAGNHFLEIQKVDKIFDTKTAEAFGITKEGQVTVMIHCGSRGLGHQVASDYIQKMESKYGFKDLPDRELVNAPIQSELGQQYYRAMCCAANFAYANKQMITHWIRGVFNKVMGSDEGMDVIYEVCHNIAKFERHNINGENRQVCVHRKGATRSLGPGNEILPEKYQKTGQPVLIPGSMGTASYILAGTSGAEEVSFSSTAHGAGRVLSRAESTRRFRGEDIKKEMEGRGIMVKGASWKGLAEESGQSYKDVDEVVRVSHELGIGKLVARLVPIGVIKG